MLLAKAESAGDDTSAEAGQVVLVGATDLLDESMSAEPSQEARDLSAVLVDRSLEVPVAKATDSVLSLGDGDEEVEVDTREEVEAAEAASVPTHGTGDPLELRQTGVRVVELSEECQVALVRGP